MSNGTTRKPGGQFDLTDEEILVTPARMLSASQRRRRRQLKNNVAKAKNRENKKQAQRLTGSTSKVNYCQGYTKKNKPCEGHAVRGAKHCVVHLNEAEKAKTGKKSLGEYKAAKIERTRTKLNAPQMARDVFEVALEKIVARYFKAVGMEFVGYDEQNNPVVIDHGIEAGIRIHGESKEGYIEMSKHPDLQAQIAVMEKLWDRIYGKPRQTQVIEGGTKPIQVQPVKNVERAKEVSELLHRTGALGKPHDGRRRASPSESDVPVIEVASGDVQPSSEGEVVPLRPGDGGT